MTRTLIRGAVISAILVLAPTYALADEREGLSSAPVSPSIAEHSFQVAQGKKQQGGGGGGGGQTCPTGYADCDGVKSNKCETNIGTDPNNCGACGKVCSLPNATAACGNGTCGIASCNTGYEDCDGDPSNGCEANVATDANNCGACGNVCSIPNANDYCRNATCTYASCATGYGDCDGNVSNGCEVNFNTTDDVFNCGACGNRCSAPPQTTSRCTNGTCGTGGCYRGYADCDNNSSNGCEVNLQSDANNCGACGNVCSFPNATSACTNNTCQMASCAAGYGDCDGNVSNGCETKILTDVSNCGACNNRCPFYDHADRACEKGICAMGNCSPGWGNCDGNGSNGCETNLSYNSSNCGACGQRCTLGTSCVNRSCQ